MTGSLTEHYIRAQIEGDRSVALAVITAALASGMSVPAVHLEVIQAAQYEIGRLWECNAISIAVEHQATAISQLALARLYERLPRSPSLGKRVVLACVEGELHDMGSRIAADFLEMAGFDVRLLGANVPPDALAERVENERPDLVALSATMTFHRPAIGRAIARLRQTSMAHVPVLLGGSAFRSDPGAAGTLDAQGQGSDVDELIAEAKRLTGAGTTAGPKGS